MNILPNKLILLDNNLNDIGSLSRVDSIAVINNQKLAERHYDNFIVAHANTIADALREAFIIAQDSSLLYLGKLLAIDALFAEIEAETKAFRRFVIVEDKLFRNQEARREVLGQILDYAKSLHETEFENLYDRLPNEHADWLDENDDLITRALFDSNFLLLICGDRIQPRLVDYIKHLKNQLSPLISIELALLSMALFSYAGQHILIPHVVALVTAEAGITIRVEVQDNEGRRLPATLALKQDPTAETKLREKISIAALLEAINLRAGEKAKTAAQALFEHSVDLGAELKPARNNCSVRVRDVDSGRYSTLFLVNKMGWFRIHLHERWASNAGISPQVAENYASRFASIFKRNPTAKGESAISLIEVGNNLEEVFAEIRTAIKALRHLDTES